MISNKIKAFLKLKNIKSVDFSKYLELKNPQSLNTKFLRDSFKTQELIKLAEMGNCYLAFIDKESNDIIIKFDSEDI